MSQQNPADCSGMGWKSGTDVGNKPHRLRTLAFGYVDNIGAFENGKVGRVVHGCGQPGNHRATFVAKISLVEERIANLE
jgi:hypothetical protein